MILSHIAHYNCLNETHYKNIKMLTFNIVKNSFDNVEDSVPLTELEDGTCTSLTDKYATHPKILSLFDATMIKKPIRNSLGCPGIYTEIGGLINSGSQVETWLEVTPQYGSRFSHRNASGIYLEALDKKQPITSFIYFISVDEGNDKFYFYENDVKTYVDIKENMLLLFKSHVKHGMEINRSETTRVYLNGNVRLLNGSLDGVYANWDTSPTHLITSLYDSNESEKVITSYDQLI